MDPFKPKRTKASGPEETIVDNITDMLLLRGWYVVRMHGNLHQFGFPDLFACHSKYGIRLIEVKNPKSYSFTGAQIEKFPKLTANGAGVYILVDATEEEYNKLFRAPNWWSYLKY